MLRPKTSRRLTPLSAVAASDRQRAVTSADDGMLVRPQSSHSTSEALPSGTALVSSCPHALPPLECGKPRSSPPRMGCERLDFIQAQELTSRKLVALAETLAWRRLTAAASKSQPDMLQASCSSPQPHSSAPQCDEPEDASARTSCHHIVIEAQRLHEQGRLSQSFLLLSSVLPNYEPHPRLWARLRAERAACSYALINLRECIDDCEAALQILAPEPSMPQEETTAFDTTSQLTERRLWTHVTRACMMREDYTRAEVYYDRFLSRGEYLGLTSEEVGLLQSEKQALSTIKLLRSAVVNADWDAALAHLRGNTVTGVTTLVSATPLKALEAVVLLELDFVDEARAILLAYLPSLLPTEFVESTASGHVGDDRPTPCGKNVVPTLADCSSEEKVLYRNLLSHYLQCTVMAAKASIYTSAAYLNIAAVLVKRCLLVEPTFAPAMSLGSYLVTVEDHLEKVNACMSTGDWPRALLNASSALQLDAKNRRLASVLHAYQAEALSEMDKPFKAIEACTKSIRLNPCSPRPYFLRALLYHVVRQPADAAVDLQRSAELAPSQYTRHRFREEVTAMHARREARAEAKERRRCTPTSPQTPPNAPASARVFPPHPPPRTASGVHRRTSPPPSSSQASHDQRGFGGSHGNMCDTRGPDRQTLYDLLHVSVTASNEEIRKAYRSLTLRYHPDKVIGETEEVQMQSLHMFKMINEAHNVLVDPAKRAVYDQSLRRPL